MKAIICTGFHRSATSLTGKTLHACGIPYAITDLGHNMANPDGFFEDWDAIKIHDQFLLEAGTNWQFTDEVVLNSSNNWVNKIYEYTKLRFQSTQLWFVKDPRASLFLNEWKQALEDRGHFLFLFRHWSLCIQSLIKRHSRELAFHPEKKISDIEKRFWIEPNCLLKMWLAYNRRILAFYKQTHDRSFLLEASSFMTNFSLSEALNKKWALDLPKVQDIGFNSEIFNCEIDNSIFNTLSSTLMEQCNELWYSLNEFADLSQRTIPKVKPTKIILEQDVLESLYQYIESKYYNQYDLCNENYFSEASEELKLAYIELKKSYPRGKKLYFEWAKKKLDKMNLIDTISKILITNSKHNYKQLCYWILHHWYDVYGEELRTIISKELMNHAFV